MGGRAGRIENKEEGGWADIGKYPGVIPEDLSGWDLVGYTWLLPISGDAHMYLGVCSTQQPVP